jgi:hypothetical protein
MPRGDRMRAGLGRRAKWLVLASIALWPMSAHAWTRAYVIEWFEPAHYFDVDEGVTSAEAPGRDCPKGANPVPDWKTILVTSYRTRAEVERFLDPAFRNDPNRSLMTYAIRGPRKEDVYLNPEAVPDPKVYEVEGTVAYGFDLDENDKTGFRSPSGERGIDNAYYKASGCFVHWRGRPRDAAGFKYGNDGMRDGDFTIVMVLSGEQDPQDDDAALLGIYPARDPMVKDANGNIASEYSFRIDPVPDQQSVIPVRIKDGVVETREPFTVQMPDWNSFQRATLTLRKSRLRFELKPDGTLFGLLGGYRDVTEHYRAWSGNGVSRRGALVEVVGRINLPGWWYALRRRADGFPDPKTGRNTAISTTYHVSAIPAFVIEPDGARTVQAPTLFKKLAPAAAAGD